MTFFSFTDQWQVLIDDQGNPLIGRLQFLDYATSEPKNVYEDINLSTAAENPQYTDITGKLEHQIFLGVGDHKVVFQRYIGTGNMKDPDQASDDSLWVTIKTEDISGLASSETASGYNVITVSNIAELRTVDQSVYNACIVLGYYAADDNIQSRTYIWDDADTRSDNFGTIIQKTGLGTGRWNMLEPQEMDSRYFGVFPNGDTHNSELTALNAWINSSYAKCKNIRFSTGTYRFVAASYTFNEKIIIEPDVDFAIAGAGTVNIYIKGDYDIQTDKPLCGTDIANVRIYFTGTLLNKTVRSSWYSIDPTETTTASIITSRVLSNYDLLIDSTLESFTGIVTYTFKNITLKAPFYYNGGLIIFEGCNIKNEYYDPCFASLLGNGYMTEYIFKKSTVRSSCFNENGFQNALLCQTDSENSVFIIDSDITFDDTWLDNKAFKFKYESGLITATTLNKYAIFESLQDLPAKQVFPGISYIGLRNQDSQLKYFLDVGAQSSTYQSWAFYSAARAALNGNGVLNLNGYRDLQLSEGDIIDYKYYGNMLEIRDGGITLAASMNLIDLQVSLINMKLTNISLTCYAYNTNVIKVDGVIVTDVDLQNVLITGTSPSSELLKTSNGGTIQNSHVTDSNITIGWLANESTVGAFGIQKLFAKDNTKLNCSLKARNSAPSITGNFIEGNSSGNYWEVKCIDSAIISNNRFYQCDLYLLDNTAVIDHVVTNNQFESTDAKWSRIIFRGLTANTAIKGSNVSNNSFIGSVTAEFVAIICEGSYSSDWVYETTQLTSASPEIFNAYNSIHKVVVKDNSSSNRYIIVPSTEGIFVQSFAFTEAALDSDDVRTFTKAIPFNNQVFYIPGAAQNFQTDVRVLGKYGNDSNPFASQLDYMKYIPAGTFGDYRYDSNYITKIYCPDSAEPLLYCKIIFKIYDSQIVSWLV